MITPSHAAPKRRLKYSPSCGALPPPLILFALTYLGLALGRIPPRKRDRTRVRDPRCGGVRLTFRDHLRLGLPVTLVSLALAVVTMAFW